MDIVGTNVNDELRRSNSYERDPTKLHAPFSFPNENLPRQARISSSTFGKPKSGGGFLTKSQNLSENTIDKPNKRPSPFFLPSSQHDSSQRRRLDDPYKSRPLLGSTSNFTFKTEDKSCLLSQGTQVAPTITHTSVVSSCPPSSPSIDDEPANISSSFANYSQKTPAPQNFYSKNHTISRFPENQPGDISASGSSIIHFKQKRAQSCGIYCRRSCFLVE